MLVRELYLQTSTGHLGVLVAFLTPLPPPLLTSRAFVRRLVTLRRAYMAATDLLKHFFLKLILGRLGVQRSYFDLFF